MENEQTNTPDTKGAEDNKPLAPDGENLSDYDKALALVKRREEATKAENETLDRKEKLAANAMLGGTGGGHIDSEKKEETPHEESKRYIKENFENLR